MLMPITAVNRQTISGKTHGLLLFGRGRGRGRSHWIADFAVPLQLLVVEQQLVRGPAPAPVPLLVDLEHDVVRIAVVLICAPGVAVAADLRAARLESVADRLSGQQALVE